jgi:CHASE1-domain containing sensor protein
MITAQEAREVLKVQEVHRILAAQEVQRILAALESQIRECSAAGLRVLRAYNADKMWHTVREFKTAHPTIIQNLVCDELRLLGFFAEMQHDGEPYIPRAIQAMARYTEIAC